MAEISKATSPKCTTQVLGELSRFLVQNLQQCKYAMGGFNSSQTASSTSVQIQLVSSLLHICSVDSITDMSSALILAQQSALQGNRMVLRSSLPNVT